jgi:hypothetical protein
MKHQVACIRMPVACAGALLLASIASQGAWAEDPAPAPAERAAIVGGALPGGAVISAAVSGNSVALAPAAGGPVTVTPISGDGTFRAVGLKPGHYQLSVRSLTVPRQTQQASFGEKVQSGLAQTGSALAQGAAKPNQAAGSMPNRISMNVTVARQTQAVDVDGKAIDLEVGPDGLVTGKVAAR